MIRLVLLLSVSTGAVIYIDRYTLDVNRKVGNWSTSFIHNENRNAIVNVTIGINKPLTKLLIYAKINMAENEHDREFKREFLRTVFDFEKISTGSRLNFIIAAFVENLKKFMDFQLRFPFQPVSGLY